MNVDKVFNRTFPDTEQNYSFKDTILYALGVGFGSEPLDEKHIDFLFEERLKASPTYANVLGHPGMWARDAEYGIDWKKLLHAEQRLEMHGTLAPEGQIVAKHFIMGLRDLGERGTMLHQRKYVIDAKTEQRIATVTNTLMLRGDLGSGDWGDAPETLSKLPETAPDSSLEVQATELQPLIYRLSGDLNPLHIDPAVATVAGFPRPILHGLSTKGMAGYALLRQFCDFDPARLGSMAVRFSRPVLPGDMIRFEFWGKAPGTIRFRAVVPNRDNLMVLDRCTAEIS
ncbi:MAG: 3-alpha,7-alpha,12-alpha-trihydroxy-5-beta-cholest-24-enoyl-CoA hydratase [Hirschia sp.]|mgnify:CR=1 FL=1|nr:3-alpha,7-alpha,12-alpha-trihydroxy-5-beta-cholest-24-enoyl-CoA hydratase [Hirschia sp.]MBF18289.1 3-alpha,7-alpha,12-alpha-trihydroxy-5-beta-cholest-24-enoyl-CoA hydratase [Hirschia sp.]